jgi:hypothetical protein
MNIHDCDGLAKLVRNRANEPARTMPANATRFLISQPPAPSTGRLIGWGTIPPSTRRRCCRCDHALRGSVPNRKA